VALSNAEVIKRLRVAALERGDCYVCRCRPVREGSKYCDQCIADRDARNSLLRAVRRQQGRCSVCGVPVKGGLWACRKHRERVNKQQAKRFATLRDKGLCRCGKPARPGMTLCARCGVQNNVRVRRRYDQLVANGQCPVCAKPWRGPEKWCARCRRQHRTRYGKAA
jgi:hypothetical protein